MSEALKKIPPGLVKGLKKGDPEAFKAIYHHFSEKLYLVSRKFGFEKEDAEEVVQEVFLKLWEKRADIKEELSLNAYLLTITKNTLLKKSKKLVVEKGIIAAFRSKGQQFTNDPEKKLIYKELKEHTRQVLAVLTKQQRAIFILRNRFGMSQKEIASRLNLSVRTVENQMFRANKRLREYISRHNILELIILFLIVSP